MADQYVEPTLESVEYTSFDIPEGDDTKAILGVRKNYENLKFDTPGITQLRVKINQQEKSLMLSLSGDLMRLNIPATDISRK